MLPWARAALNVTLFHQTETVTGPVARMVASMAAPPDMAIWQHALDTAFRTDIWLSVHNAPNAPPLRPWILPTLSVALTPKVARLPARPEISLFQLFTTLRISILPSRSSSEARKAAFTCYRPFLYNAQRAAIVHHSSQSDILCSRGPFLLCLASQFLKPCALGVPATNSRGGQ